MSNSLIDIVEHIDIGLLPYLSDIIPTNWWSSNFYTYPKNLK